MSKRTGRSFFVLLFRLEPRIRGFGTNIPV
jgi:hypothetical protein